jgi:mannonate dehydratase
MRNLMDGMRAGAKLLLFAFERAHDERGAALPERSGF